MPAKNPQCRALRREQHGAILVTSLLLLLVLTIIGISAMSMTRMQERMAGNLRDQTLGLQGAEAALRDGEDRLRALTAVPIGCGSVDCDSKIYAPNVLESAPDQTNEWWQKQAREFGTQGEADLGEDLAEDPRYIVEEVAFIKDDLLRGDPDTGRDFYQVTSRSSGGSGQANVVVQSTFARRFN